VEQVFGLDIYKELTFPFLLKGRKNLIRRTLMGVFDEPEM
jgi:hypothetical protein